jgi:membrane protein implicated in regulation of membrane protease activity
MQATGIYLGLLVYGAGVLVLSLFGALGHDAHGDGNHDAHGGDGHDAHGDGHDQDHGGAAQRPEGSLAAIEKARRGDAGTRAVSRIASFLRTTVYLSLGAGATGLFAASRGLGPLEGAAWAAGAGVLVLAVARIARRLVRRDLDSSFKSEEFLMEVGVVVVPAAPGEMGKIEVRKYGASAELYVKAAAASRGLAKGERVRVVDCGDDFYLVEPVAAGGKEV